MIVIITEKAILECQEKSLAGIWTAILNHRKDKELIHMHFTEQTNAVWIPKSHFSWAWVLNFSHAI